jgi:hypothetical protein
VVINGKREIPLLTQIEFIPLSPGQPGGTVGFSFAFNEVNL